MPDETLLYRLAPTSRNASRKFAVEAVVIRSTRTGRLMAVNASAFVSCGRASEGTGSRIMPDARRRGIGGLSCGIAASVLYVAMTLLVCGIVAFRGRVRACSAATLVVVSVPAIFSLSYVAAYAANGPTPGMGLVERVAQYGYQFWQATIAVVLLRRPERPGSRASAFTAPEGKPGS